MKCTNCDFTCYTWELMSKHWFFEHTFTPKTEPIDYDPTNPFKIPPVWKIMYGDDNK